MPRARYAQRSPNHSEAPLRPPQNLNKETQKKTRKPSAQKRQKRQKQYPETSKQCPETRKRGAPRNEVISPLVGGGQRSEARRNAAVTGGGQLSEARRNAAGTYGGRYGHLRWKVRRNRSGTSVDSTLRHGGTQHGHLQWTAAVDSTEARRNAAGADSGRWTSALRHGRT